MHVGTALNYAYPDSSPYAEYKNAGAWHIQGNLGVRMQFYL